MRNKRKPNLEDIYTELEGVKAIVTAQQVACSEDIQLILPVLQAYLYGVQTHLDRILDDVSRLINEQYADKKSAQSR